MDNRTALRKRTQRGQAAFEFIFAMLIIMGMVAVLFQVLHFELDVFNKTMIARYKLLEEARVDESETDVRMITTTIEGKPLGELIPWEVPFQASSTNDLKYGPKEVYWQCGTKRFFPGGDAAETALKVAIAALMLVDHYEDTAGNAESVFSGLNSAVGAVGDACP